MGFVENETAFPVRLRLDLKPEKMSPLQNSKEMHTVRSLILETHEHKCISKRFVG